MLPDYYIFFFDLFNNLGVPFSTIPLMVTLTLWLCAFIIAGLSYLIIAKPVGKFLQWFAINHTKTKWDDYILTTKVIRAVGFLVFCILLYRLLPMAMLYYPEHLSIVYKVCRILLIIGATNVIIAIVGSFYDATQTMKMDVHGLAVYRNIIQTAVAAIAVLLIISILLNRNLAYIFSALGAMAAVLLLVFRDTLLGVMAGIKLSFNKMLKPGDWISIPKFGANGIVQDVRLSTIVVENWDNTIISVPAYALISDGFQNLQFMKDKGGRRIMRSINIDASSVRYFNEDELDRFKKESWWKDVKDVKPINLTLFRIYLHYLLAGQPDARGDMLLMVRELEPTAEGIPLQIYFFTSKVEWKNYEERQADIMDEIFAAVPEFSLRIFQHPSGYDLKAAFSERQ